MNFGKEMDEALETDRLPQKGEKSRWRDACEAVGES